MSKVTVELKLSAEDQEAIAARVAEQIEAAKGTAAGKGSTTKGTATTTKGKPPAGKGKPPADDDFDDVDGDGDADDFGEGGDGDGDDEPTFERSDVTEALRGLSAATSKQEAMKVLKKVGGVGALSELEEDKFAAVIKAAKTATAKAKK